MKRFLSYFLAAAVITLTISCRRGPKVIDSDDLSEIYAEMFLLDQRISGNFKLRRMADTTRVYEAVLQKYGYTYEDYNATLEYYLENPKRHNRVINEAEDILKEKVAVFEAEQSRINEREAYKERVRHFRPDTICMLDTLTFLDSLYKFDFQRGRDTLYDGPRMFVPADTVKCFVSIR